VSSDNPLGYFLMLMSLVRAAGGRKATKTQRRLEFSLSDELEELGISL
jgi:hypothetical protein